MEHSKFQKNAKQFKNIILLEPTCFGKIIHNIYKNVFACLFSVHSTISFIMSWTSMFTVMRATFREIFLLLSGWWWEKYFLKRSLRNTCSWCDKLIVLLTILKTNFPFLGSFPDATPMYLLKPPPPPEPNFQELSPYGWGTQPSHVLYTYGKPFRPNEALVKMLNLMESTARKFNYPTNCNRSYEKS